MFFEIKCEYLKLFIDESSIEVLNLQSLKNGFFKAIDSNNNIFHCCFKKGGFSFENYEKEPAITLNSGAQIWMENNRIHREGDLPAVFLANDYEFYFKHNKPHRDGDLPAVILRWCSSFKSSFSFNDIIFNNNDGSGFCIWCKNGKIHRFNKPAFMDNIDHENDKCFLNGIQFPTKEFKKQCMQINVLNF